MLRSIELRNAQAEDDVVRHLCELGYVDPSAVAVRNTLVQQQLEAELQKAKKLLAGGAAEEGIRELERLAAEDSAWITPHQLLVELYYRSGRLAEASTHLEWLAEHAVEHPGLSLIRGTVAMARREMGTALEELEYAAYVEPSLPGVYSLLGTAYLRLRRLAEARKSFEQAIDTNDGDAVAYVGLASIALASGECEEAAGLALEALQRDLHSYEGHCRLGLALMRLSRLADATTAFEQAARVNPRRGAAYGWLARIAHESGDLEAVARFRDLAIDGMRQRKTQRSRGC